MTLSELTVGQNLADGQYQIASAGRRCGVTVRYQAKNTVTNKTVTLTVPHPRLAGSGVFNAELENVCRHSIGHCHQGVSMIIDYVATDQRTFVVTPEAKSSLAETLLPQQLQVGMISVQKFNAIKRWLPNIAQTLDSLHRLGIIHRNILPETVFVDDGFFAQVDSFVITQALNTLERLPQPKRTRSRIGLPFGCVDYLAPEVLLEQPLDGRSDQFSLAVLLFYSLAGFLPFRPAPSYIVAARQLTVVPPTLKSVLSWVSPGTSEAIGRAMSKSPNDRFSSCQQFASAVLADAELLVRPLPLKPNEFAVGAKLR